MSFQKGDVCLLLKGYSLATMHRGVDFSENAMSTVRIQQKGLRDGEWMIRNLSSKRFIAYSRCFELEYRLITVYTRHLMPIDKDPDTPRMPKRLIVNRRPTKKPVLA